MANKSTKGLYALASLGIVLLVCIVIFAVALLLGEQFKRQICTAGGGTFTTTCSTLTASYNSTVTLLSQITTVVGFVGIVVLASIGLILIVMVKGYAGKDDM